jgi:hypothetical protein
MNPQPTYPQGNYPQTPPPAKSNKKLWIILGLLIGIPTILMGGCVACVALLGLSAANNPNLANSNSAPVFTSTPQAPSTSSGSATSNSTSSAPSSSASTAGVTMANYNRIKNGMSYSQVVQILGKEGTELSSNDIAGIQTVMYQWDGDSWGGNMNVMFQNGKVIQKAQFGLK